MTAPTRAPFRATIGGKVRAADLMITGRNVQWSEWVATCDAEGLELGIQYTVLFSTDSGLNFLGTAYAVAFSQDVGGWYAELRGNGELTPV
jgi:hypothetical protein